MPSEPEIDIFSRGLTQKNADFHLIDLIRVRPRSSAAD
jgi:hypothetical protein